ncbi:MAG: hypothetical protein GEU96_01310 [Propionibacteriales bacterium]|nr:hypothetical protein [Propionibacteriales bacterium]
MKLEAVFIAADQPAEAAAFLTGGLGLPDAESGDEGQVAFSGLGTFVALEPVESGSHAGAVTLWFRVDDAVRQTETLLEQGADLVQAPASAGGETVAVVLTPHGVRIGLIS